MTEILTLTELAARLRVSERTIYRLVEAGCPSMLVGSRRRFDWQRVREWTEGQQCRFEKTPQVAGTSRSASIGDAFIAAARRVHLRVTPKP